MKLDDQTHAPLPRLAPRRPDSHKGDFGRAVLIGGSRGMSGAISLSGIATLRSGAGLVTLAVPGDVLPIATTDLAVAKHQNINCAIDGDNIVIIGMMLESNLHSGAQKVAAPDKLEYGVSITDGCIGWDETQELILSGHAKLTESPAAA